MGEGWEKERMDGWMDGLMDRRRNEGKDETERNN